MLNSPTHPINARNMLAQRGQSIVEYALILSLVSIVAIVALTNLGERITQIFQTITDTLNNL